MAGWLSTLLPLALGASAPAVAPTPALRTAQETLQEVEEDRRKEDLTIEANVNEVLALAQKYRPQNTTRAYAPKQNEWQVSKAL